MRHQKNRLLFIYNSRFPVAQCGLWIKHYYYYYYYYYYYGFRTLKWSDCVH